MIPSAMAVTNRPSTAPGAGRMNGGKPLTSTTSCQTSRKTTIEPTTEMAAERVMPRPPVRRLRPPRRGGRGSCGRSPRRRPHRDRRGGAVAAGRPATSATTRPGRGESTTTRSATRIASAMLWVTSTIVWAVRAQRRSSSRSNRSRLSASSALNGSSSSSTSGSSASARASATRCRVPPLSSDGRFVTMPGSSWTSSVSSRSRAARRSRRPAGQLQRVGDVRRRAPPRQQARLLEDQPDRPDRARPSVRSSRRTSPRSGARSPAMTRSSVDLPQPLGPISATMPPPGTSRSRPSRTGSRSPARVGKDRSRSRTARAPGPRTGSRASRPLTGWATVSGRMTGATAG